MGRGGAALRVAIVATAAVVAAAALTVWWLSTRSHEQIGANELRAYPPLALVMAEGNRGTYAHSGDLYVTGGGVTTLRRLRRWTPLLDSARDGAVYGTYGASWSPDRRQIALTLSVWYGDPYGQVAVVSRDGKGLRAVSPASIVGDVTWSPTGDLVYVYNSELRIIPAGGHKAVHLWRPPHGVTIDENPAGGDVAWSPDARRLVVLTSRGLLALERDGSGAVAVTHDGADALPRWSPSGCEIAFIRRPGCYGEFECRKPVNIYVVGAHGGRVRRVTSNAKASSLRWSRDGRSIVVTQTDDTGEVPKAEVDVIGVGGGQLRRLAIDASALASSPDGRRLLFSRRDDLWVMDADGSRQTRLPFDDRGMSVISADWGP